MVRCKFWQEKCKFWQECIHNTTSNEMAINYLRNKEICFVSENFDNVTEKEDYLYAVFKRDAASLERALELYL